MCTAVVPPDHAVAPLLYRREQNLNFRFSLNLELLWCTSDACPLDHKLCLRWLCNGRTIGLSSAPSRAYTTCCPSHRWRLFHRRFSLSPPTCKQDTLDQTHCNTKTHTPGEGERSRFLSVMVPKQPKTPSCKSYRFQQVGRHRLDIIPLLKCGAIPLAPPGCGEISNFRQASRKIGSAAHLRRQPYRSTAVGTVLKGERGDRNRSSRIWQARNEPVGRLVCFAGE